MNKILSFILAAVLLFSLSACGTDSGRNDKISDVTDTEVVTDPTGDGVVDNGQIPDVAAYGGREGEAPATSVQIRENPERILITRDEAIEIALEHFGLTADEAFDIDAEIEKEFSGTFWEVEFETSDFEYTVFLEAEGGVVIREYKEIND